MVAKIYFFHRPQSDRNPVRPLRAGVPLLWLLPDDADALATGLSRPGTAGDRQIAATHFRPWHGGWETDACLSHLARRDAWRDQGFPRRRAARLCGLRKFRRAAATRRPRHDFPES